MDHRGRTVVAVPVVLAVAVGCPAAAAHHRRRSGRRGAADRRRQRARLRDRDDARRGHRPGRSGVPSSSAAGGCAATSAARADRWLVGALAAALPLAAACVVVGLVGLAGAGWVGTGPGGSTYSCASGCPTSAVLDGDLVGPFVAGLVPHPPLDGAGVGRVDVRRERLAGDVDARLNSRHGWSLILYSMSGSSPRPRVGAREVELLLAGDRGRAGGEVDRGLRLLDRRLLGGLLRRLLARGARQRDEGAALLLGGDRVGQVQRLLPRLARRGVALVAEADDAGATIAASPVSSPTTTATATSATRPVMTGLSRVSPTAALPPDRLDVPTIVAGPASRTQPARSTTAGPAAAGCGAIHAPVHRPGDGVSGPPGPCLASGHERLPVRSRRDRAPAGRAACPAGIRAGRHDPPLARHRWVHGRHRRGRTPPLRRRRPRSPGASTPWPATWTSAWRSTPGPTTTCSRRWSSGWPGR